MQKLKLKKSQRSFTLIELLIVIGIIAVLVGLAVVAVNPAEQFAKANNTRRQHDLRQILSAIQQNMIDNKGFFVCSAGDIPATPTVMGSGLGQYDICDCLVSDYLGALPVDPQKGTYNYCDNYDSQYTIQKASVIIGAPWTQLGEVINTTLPGEVTVKIPPGAQDKIPPTVNTISPTSATVNVATNFSVTVSDNVAVTNCNLFVNGTDQGAMNLSVSPCTNCAASKSYTFTSAGTFPMYAGCSDAAGSNTNGPSVNVTATSPITEYPVWQSCESESSTRTPFSWTLTAGYKFTTPSIPITVTKLCGRWSGGQRTVRLQDASFNTLGSALVTPSGDSWDCKPIIPKGQTNPAPVLISASTIYYVSEWGNNYSYESPANFSSPCNNVSITKTCMQGNGSDSGFNSSPIDCYSPAIGIMLGLVDIMFVY